MSGQTIGSIIGATIGWFIGGPTGAAIGAQIGGTIGSSYDSLPDREGPRLGDLSAGGSEYGKPIPIAYGTIGMAGNIIWAADIVEVRSETETGGKGDGPSQVTVSYTYFGSFAVAVCEGEADITRIWAGPDKRLIFDAATGTLEGSVRDPVGLYEAKYGSSGGAMLRLYNGSEFQMPDPMMEAALGVGNVPAYRGTTYLVLENFPLEKDFNRLPFLTIEVSSKVLGAFDGNIPVTYLGTASTLPYSYQPNVLACYDPVNKNVWSMHPNNPAMWGQTGYIYCNSDVSLTLLATLEFPIANTGPSTMYFQPGSPNKIIICGGASGPYDYRREINADTRELIGGALIGTVASTISGFKGLLSPAGLRHEIRNNGYLTFDGLVYVDGELVGLQNVNPEGPRLSFIGGVCNAGEYFVICQPYVTTRTVVSRWAITSSLATHVRTFEGVGVGEDYEIAYDSDRSLIVFYTGYKTFKTLNIATGAINTHTFGNAVGADTDPPPPTFGLTGSVVYMSGYYIFSMDGNETGTGVTLWLVNPTTLVADYTFTYEVDTPEKSRMLVHPMLVPGQNKAYVIAFDQNSVKRLYFRQEGARLSAVVSDLSSRAGLLPSQYNTTALTDVVDGYAIARQMPARGAIDALRPAYYFDAVESNGVVKYVKRGGPIAEVIGEEDLAAHEAGQENPDPLMVTRQMDVELPRAVYVKYLSRATDYAPATKYASRLVGAEGDEATLELPMVLTDTKAQEAAEVNLHSAWGQRLGYQFSVPLKLSHLEPTDVVVVKDRVMRITKIDRTPRGVLKVEAVGDDANFYAPSVQVTETPDSGKLVVNPGATNLELM